jgi:CRISPR system Cascade subunit CasB
MTEPQVGEQQFVEYLESLVRGGDRGAIANLRRGLGKPPGDVRQMDRHVLPFVPESVAHATEDSYYLLAALFAFWHQGKNDVPACRGNLGESLRCLAEKEAQETGSTIEEARGRHEKRLVALLNCHREDLAYHLRQVVGLLKSQDIPVAWHWLLRDLSRWDRDDRVVQRNWARGFWGSTHNADAAAAANVTAALESDTRPGSGAHEKGGER